MNTTEKTGSALQGGDMDARREAARLLGSTTSERKKQTSAANGSKFKGHGEEVMEKIKAAHRARWAKYREEKAKKEAEASEPNTN